MSRYRAFTRFEARAFDARNPLCLSRSALREWIGGSKQSLDWPEAGRYSSNHCFRPLNQQINRCACAEETQQEPLGRRQFQKKKLLAPFCEGDGPSTRS